MAKEEIEKAWVLKDSEKLFQHEPHILALINVANFKEAYLELKDYVDKRIKEKSESEKAKMEIVLKRCEDLHNIEQRIIAQGKTPTEGNGNSWLLGDDENLEPNIIAG